MNREVNVHRPVRIPPRPLGEELHSSVRVSALHTSHEVGTCGIHGIESGVTESRVESLRVGMPHIDEGIFDGLAPIRVDNGENAGAAEHPDAPR